MANQFANRRGAATSTAPLDKRFETLQKSCTGDEFVGWATSSAGHADAGAFRSAIDVVDAEACEELKTCRTQLAMYADADAVALKFAGACGDADADAQAWAFTWRSSGYSAGRAGPG